LFSDLFKKIIDKGVQALTALFFIVLSRNVLAVILPELKQLKTLK
jgi:hypothetical protein